MFYHFVHWCFIILVLTGRQNVVPLQDACRCQIVDDILETDVFENRTIRRAIFCVQKGLFLTQICRAKPFFSNRPNKQKTNRETFTGCCPDVPVLRLHSHASASARSCLMGPSHKGLSCRNIHCRGRNRKEKLAETWWHRKGFLGIIFVYLFQSSVDIHFHLHDKQVRRLDEQLHHLCAVLWQKTHKYLNLQQKWHR